MKVKTLLISVVAVYALAVLGIRFLSTISSYESIRLGDSVYVIHKDELRSESLRTTIQTNIRQLRISLKNSSVLTNRRALAAQGVERYADWHYSMEGSLIMQGIALLKGAEALGAKIMESETFRSTVNTVSARLASEVFSQLHLSEEEEVRLHNMIAQSESQVAMVLTNQLKSSSLVDFPSSATFGQASIDATANYKLIASIGTIFGVRFLIRSLIKKQGAKAGQAIVKRVVIRAVAKQATKQGGRFAAAGSAAAVAGGACALAGPLGAGCAIVAGLAAFIGSEYVFNRIDELVTRDELTAKLMSDVNQTIDKMVSQMTVGIDRFEAILLGTSFSEQVTPEVISPEEADQPG